MISIKFFHQIKTACCVVTINTFLIFMKQYKTTSLCLLYHAFHAFHNHITRILRISIFWQIKTKHTNIWCLKDISYALNTLQLFHMSFKIILNANFSNWRTNCGYTDSSSVKTFFCFLCLLIGKICYASAISTSKLHKFNSKLI